MNKYELAKLKQEMNAEKRLCKKMIYELIDIRDNNEQFLKKRKELIYKIVRVSERIGIYEYKYQEGMKEDEDILC